MAVEGETVSHHYILATRKFINNFPLQSLEYATYSSVQLRRTAETIYILNEKSSIKIVFYYQAILPFS